MKSRLPNDKEDQGINKLIHEPSRLKIMAQLYVVDSLDFLFLLQQTGLSQGNLSAHLIKLENAGFVDIEKQFSGKKPQTMISISEKGDSAFKEYMDHMKRMLNGLD